MYIASYIISKNCFIIIRNRYEFSTGVAVAITFAVTFIITLVVTALITYIITSLYYKHLIDHIRKLFTSQKGDHA